nr:reverse transcriptase domain-containing protein [Tanacetum cinerariifolium]
MDSESSCEVIYEHCFLKLKTSIRSLKVNSKISLVGFLGEHSWPLGEVPLEVTKGKSLYTRTETLNFVIVKSNSPYNLLLGRKTMQKIGIVVSAIHAAINFTLMPFNMEHKLNEYKHIEPVKQKKCSLAQERNEAACKEVDKLTMGIKANILKFKEITDLKPLRMLKEIQILNEKLAALSRFLSKDANRNTLRGRQRHVSQEIRNCQRSSEFKKRVEVVQSRSLKFDGSSASLMLVSPEGNEYTYTLRFELETTNNEAEYKALVTSLRIAEEIEIKDLAIFIHSQLVANQVKNKREKDKIGTKPDKNEKRGEAGKSQKQLQSREQEKMKKMQVEGPKMKIPTKLLKKEERKGLELQFTQKCSSCGTLYTRDCSCSKGSVEDKILVPKPPKNCVRYARCGHPVNGPYCQGCTLLREKLEEDLVTYFQNIQNTSESSNGSTNDHGVNPLHIDECCCECGEALDGIICQHCACKSCGKGTHIGYNCPPKVSIISNPKPCNQTMNNEPLQTLPSFDSTCYSDKEISVPCASKPNFVDESSNIFNPPLQPPIYSCEFYGRNPQYGHYCTPQAPFINPKPGYSQDFNFPQGIHIFQQQYIYCDQYGGPHETFQCQQVISCEPFCKNCGGPHKNFQCQPLNYYEPNPTYDSNYSSFDQTHPPQFPVVHPPPKETSIEISHDPENVINSVQTFLRKFNRYAFFKTPKVLLLAWDRISKIKDVFENKKNKPEDIQELFRKLLDDLQNIHEELAEFINSLVWNRPAVYDDDDDVDYTIAITPVLSTEEPDNSLSMRDEHLDTILATELDEVINSSVEDLIPIPSEFKDILDIMCDVHLVNNPTP